MSYWLLKTEPESFSYNDLELRGKEPWNGVRGFKALKFLRLMKPGDPALIYHTGKTKAIIGVGEVSSLPYPDPAETDPRFVVVDVVPRYRLKNPVTLREIKADPFFSHWSLVLEPRLSVMPVAPEWWQRVHLLANTPE